MMVIVAVVRVPGDARVVACGEAARVVEVMVAERKGEVQRKRCKRKHAANLILGRNHPIPRTSPRSLPAICNVII